MATIVRYSNFIRQRSFLTTIKIKFALKHCITSPEAQAVIPPLTVLVWRPRGSKDTLDENIAFCLTLNGGNNDEFATVFYVSHRQQGKEWSESHHMKSTKVSTSSFVGAIQARNEKEAPLRGMHQLDFCNVLHWKPLFA